MAKFSILFTMTCLIRLMSSTEAENIQIPNVPVQQHYAVDITKELQSKPDSNSNVARLVENQIPYPVYVRDSQLATKEGFYQTAVQFLSLIVRDMFVYFIIRLFITKLINVLGLFVDIQAILSDNWSRYLIKVVLNSAMQFLSQIVYYLMGGTAMLVIGGLIAALICHYTNLCNINLAAYNLLNQNQDWKSGGKPLITPEKLTSAAILIQDAIGKYNQLNKKN